MLVSKEFFHLPFHFCKIQISDLQEIVESKRLTKHNCLIIIYNIMKEYLTYSLVSELTLFQILISSSHLKVQVLSKLMFLAFRTIYSFVAPVQSLACHSFARVLLLEQLGCLGALQLFLGLISSNADWSLSMSARRDS